MDMLYSISSILESPKDLSKKGLEDFLNEEQRVRFDCTEIRNLLSKRAQP